MRFRGYSLVEIGVTLVIVAVLALITIPAFNAARRGADRTATLTFVASASVHARTMAATTVDFTLPAAVVADLVASQSLFTSAAPASGEVSPARLSDTEMLYVSPGPNGECGIVIDDLTTDTLTYAWDSSAGTCTAAVAVSVAASVTGASPSSPAEVDI